MVLTLGFPSSTVPHICQAIQIHSLSGRSIVVGNASFTAFETGFIDPFWQCRNDVRDVVIGKWQLCRHPQHVCHTHHGASRPGLGFHPDCLQVFMRHCSAPDPLDRLWHSCAWRRVPWTGAGVPPFRLSKRPVWHFVDGLALAVELCGLRGRAALPDIVAASILERLDLDRDSYFWSYIAALDLAKRHSSATSQPLRVFRLSRVLSWERGTFPQLVASNQSREDLPSVIRLSIDHDGLKKIERLTGRPTFCRERFDNLAFVVVEESRFGVAIAQLKVTCWSAMACFPYLPNRSAASTAFSTCRFFKASKTSKIRALRSGIRPHHPTSPTVSWDQTGHDQGFVFTPLILPPLLVLHSSSKGRRSWGSTDTPGVGLRRWSHTKPSEIFMGQTKIALGSMFRCLVTTPLSAAVLQ
jgi:hypothetical protein